MTSCQNHIQIAEGIREIAKFYCVIPRMLQVIKNTNRKNWYTKTRIPQNNESLRIKFQNIKPHWNSTSILRMNFRGVFLSFQWEAKYFLANIYRSKCVIKCAAKIKKIGWEMKILCPKTFLNSEFCMGKRQAVEVTIFPKHFKLLNILSTSKCTEIIELQNPVKNFRRIQSLNFWILSLAHKFPFPYYVWYTIFIL